VEILEEAVVAVVVEVVAVFEVEVVVAAAEVEEGVDSIENLKDHLIVSFVRDIFLFFSL
jgi:hypothetical protein